MAKKFLALFMATTLAATTLLGCNSAGDTSKKNDDSSTSKNEEKVTIEVAVSGSAQDMLLA